MSSSGRVSLSLLSVAIIVPVVFVALLVLSPDLVCGVSLGIGVPRSLEWTLVVVLRLIASYLEGTMYLLLVLDGLLRHLDDVGVLLRHNRDHDLLIPLIVLACKLILDKLVLVLEVELILLVVVHNWLVVWSGVVLNVLALLIGLGGIRNLFAIMSGTSLLE